ncbi:MAG TPA: ABC transporter substrate-binding protein [Acidimicrobiia bacterium]|nr:ABC transporter substrate-binding protein [Acidimicrobiia bacterium]
MLSRKQSRNSRVRGATALVAIALVAASCGGSHGTATPPPGSTGTPTTAAPQVVKFGTLDSPCGPGTAKGATDKGVTDTSIKIGYGDDAGYSAAAGLDKEMSDAVKPLIKWCNDQGGINGRKVVGTYYDAQVLQVTKAITQACSDKVFMLVGQGFVLDANQEQTRIQCQLSTIPGFAVGTAFASGSGMQQPIPNPGDEEALSSAYQVAKLFPAAVTKAAFAFADFPATQETRDKAAAGYPKAGWKFLNCDQHYNIAGESDWKPFARNLKKCGVQAVVWVGSPDPNLENFLNAAKQEGFKPTAWVTDPNQYTAAFAKWNGQNGGAADNVYVRQTNVPFELAAQVPAVKQYVDLVTKSHGTIGLLGEQSASAFLLWATAVKSCGSTVTAKCVLDAAAAQKDWTGGGLHLPTNPGNNTAPKCGMLLKLTGPQWVKVVPTGNEVFDCNDKYVAKGISTSAVTAAKINAQRVATQFGTFTPK